MKYYDKAIITATGDPSAGIPGTTIEVSGAVLFDPDCYAKEDRNAAKNSIIGILARAFQEILDEPVHVMLVEAAKLCPKCGGRGYTYIGIGKTGKCRRCKGKGIVNE